MIQANNISFQYEPNKLVLNDLSFSIAKGETLAVVGASGCGKSTLLRIISGYLPHFKHNLLNGTILIDNQIPNEYRKSEKLAIMFQESTLLPYLNVEQNIALPLNIRGVQNLEEVYLLIDKIGLKNFSKYMPSQLSGGMKTRVSLARSFVTHPELLLLDEPFSALDIAWKSRLYIELEKLREQTSTTVVIVTHDVQEALLLSNHVLVMNNMGCTELYKEINTKFSISDRVKNISEYLNSVYNEYVLPIQNAIINGQHK